MKDDAITLSKHEVVEARKGYVRVMGKHHLGFSCFLAYREECEESQEEAICRLCKRLTQFMGGNIEMELVLSRKEVEEFYTGAESDPCNEFGHYYACSINRGNTETPADGECALCKRIEDFAREGGEP